MAQKKFKVTSSFKPAGDQPLAIRRLVEGLGKGYRDQTLLGVTGSGKTFTMAKVIEKVQKPTLVIAHNKTLAAQLASEFREFFPDNAVHYFVSDYDYYQPEAYVPGTDTYIPKDASINDEITRLRNAATQSLLTRRDVIIVASVSCIFGMGDPADYYDLRIKLKVGEIYKRAELLRQLTAIRYDRNDVNFVRGTFRVRGEILDIFPAYLEETYRIEFFGDRIKRIRKVDCITGEILEEPKTLEIFPAMHFITQEDKLKKAIVAIRKELTTRLKELKQADKLVEEQRLEQRTNHDLEMLETIGHVSGIENYSRHMGGRAEGEPPPTLISYYPDNFLLFIDESHMTIPQIRGMYSADKSRKETLVKHGFRLPSALDNRPLKFDEFSRIVKQTIYVSATPAQEELGKSKQVVEQIVRPTGLIDPEVEVRKTGGQIDDLVAEIRERVSKGQRVLITTLTKKTAEALTEFLQEKNIRVQYIHSEVETFERIDILRDLRVGKYDVLVGINLLREGLDLPEVSLVAILDADKEGFLRSTTALIQNFGRASRHIEGKVIMYADRITDSMQRAIDESNRRRKKQVAYNKKHHITPQSIIKEIKDLREGLPTGGEDIPREEDLNRFAEKANEEEVKAIIKELEDEMDLAAKNLEFEKVAELRDRIDFLKEQG